jgi:DNA-binding transcriptional ArsR family regulator
MNKAFIDQLSPHWERTTAVFSALGDATRQKILLLFGPREEICVTDIAAVFRLSRPAISHHLKVLRNAGLLACEKRGKEVYYRINENENTDILHVVHEIAERESFVASRQGETTGTEDSDSPLHSS